MTTIAAKILETLKEGPATRHNIEAELGLYAGSVWYELVFAGKIRAADEWHPCYPLLNHKCRAFRAVE